MPTITGIGTTFDLPNYHGELMTISPTETPLLSAAGGVGGGKQTRAKTFEWQAEELRAPDSRPRLEGAEAPQGEAVARTNVTNNVQIFHESVETSYTKQAASGEYTTPNAVSADGSENPINDEHAHQVALALRTIATDVNYVFWHGKKNNPPNNATPRTTGGLFEAAATNAIGPEVRSAATATSTLTDAGHGLSVGDHVAFVTIATGGVRYDRVYAVVESTTNTFKVSERAGGAPIDLGTGSVTYVPVTTALTVDTVNAAVQAVFDNGGLSDLSAATIFVSSTQKIRLSKAYGDAYGKADPITGNVGGVPVSAIATDFGTLNVAIDRALPPDALAIVSVDELDPVFLSVPGKGVLFEEELAKTGSSERTQIYGEIGLKWGNERAHGVLRGLAITDPVAPVAPGSDD